MKLRAKAGAWVAGVAASLVTLWLTWVFVVAGVESHATFIQGLPAPVRLYYINQVLDQPEPDCGGCYGRIAAVLRALVAARAHGEDYGLDYVRLFPLVRRWHEFDEPIPMLACGLLLLRRDPRIYLELAQAFKQQPEPLKLCIWNQLSAAREFDPAEYELTRTALLKVPQFWDWMIPAGL